MTEKIFKYKEEWIMTLPETGCIGCVFDTNICERVSRDSREYPCVEIGVNWGFKKI